MTEPHVMELNDILTFGKYRGSRVEDIIESDVEYIKWCIENDVITLTEEAESYYLEHMTEEIEKRDDEREENEKINDYRMQGASHERDDDDDDE